MKKAVKTLSVLTALLLVLAACASPSATPPASNSAGDPAPAPAAGAIEEGASLVYWSMWNEAEPQGMVVSEAVAAFTAATGVKIDVNFSGRDIRQTFEPAVAGGETIDIFEEDMDRVNNAWAAYLRPLDDLVDGVYSDTNGQPYRSIINQPLINLAAELGGGSVKVIPMQPNIFTTFYNKDLFTAAGITAPPATWEEFLDACAKLKANGVAALTVDDAYMGCLFGYMLDRIVGAEKTVQMAKDMDFTDPGVLRACQLLEELAVQGYLHPNVATNVWPAGQLNEFAKGEAAMYLNGSWLPNEIKEQTADFNWGAFAWPAIDPAGDGTEAHNYAGQCFAINKDCQYPNAAFAFIRWMTVGEWDNKLAAETLGVPMSSTAQWPVQLAEAKVVFDNSSKRLPWAVDMETQPEVNAAIKTGIASLVSGAMNAQQFADSLAKL